MSKRTRKSRVRSHGGTPLAKVYVGEHVMAGKNTAVFAIFPSRHTAETAVDRLISAGFRNDDVSVLAPDQKVTH